jgi:hypothetical protein
MVCQLFNESVNELGLRHYSILYGVETCLPQVAARYFPYSWFTLHLASLCGAGYFLFFAAPYILPRTYQGRKPKASVQES